MTCCRRALLALVCGGLIASGFATTVKAHSGPDPVAHWYFTAETVADDVVSARLGPDAAIQGDPQLERNPRGSALRFDGQQDCLVVAAPAGAADHKYRPDEYLTVAAWVSVDSHHPNGWIASTLERDADAQRGWGLGYENGRFCFALSTVAADDGNGRLTTLRARSNFAPGKFYHVVGTFDGAEMRLYVNGELEAAAHDQAGPIYQPRNAAYVLGASADRDERVSHKGLIRDVAVYDLAATEKWVAGEFEHASELTELEPPEVADELSFVVSPYLQFVTQDRITVMWETSRPASSVVRFGQTGKLEKTISSDDAVTIHEIELSQLDPATPYYYQVETADDSGKTLCSPLLSFQTASGPDEPFAFGVLADMQYNPRVCKALSDQLWMQRPNFVIIPGDLTDTGPNKSHWTEHFFPGMQPLASRVAFFPVLGNHEQDSRHYYDYMSLPDPEYYYTFHYGNAQFFMLDSNREVREGSEQYKWLETQLRESTATWKFVSYHHPSYSSDEDDYGDLWQGERSTYGDERMRPLTTLYDRYGVDIVWNGHIHSYERTWPLRDNKVEEQHGTIYMITGGAGGQLETAGPVKPWFQNNVKHGHHYCLVSVNGRTLQFKAFDLQGRLFDYLAIEKRAAPTPTTPAAVASRP
ncbi:MAG: metallophosphoesterase [Planctomycetales bacterium]|nr:metallophosphoesterase [Planctomycetales bacterium]